VLSRPGVPAASQVSLLILQHSREQREVKGTARLLHLALAGSRLLVGDRWPTAPDPSGPGQLPDPAAAPAPHRRDVLLYPATPGDAALPAPPPLETAWLAQPTLLRLVVIDGTWRKSRRMLYDSPWLQSLPRLALADPPPSRYRVRRARGGQQRSTFEAVLLALAALAPNDAASLAPLWALFEAFVDTLDRQGAAAETPLWPPP
jgi:DTW domain-containing protein YfiP